MANKDAGGLSDPICVVYGFSSTKTKKELGRTEYIMNTLNPHFKRNIGLKFLPDEDQILEFRLYDVDFLSGAEVCNAVISGTRIYFKSLGRRLYQKIAFWVLLRLRSKLFSKMRTT